VQSIGGGFWLQTMIALENLGIDPDKYDLKMRVLGGHGHRHPSPGIRRCRCHGHPLQL
jgi:hypothetical protein